MELTGQVANMDGGRTKGSLLALNLLSKCESSENDEGGLKMLDGIWNIKQVSLIFR